MGGIVIFKNQNFQNSLRCLQHPATLISIALLILNDHILKASIPSWFTGKLSDFAGLFFFPFIIAAGLSLLLARSKHTLQQVGILSFGLVAVWFFLLKTFQPVNFLTTQLTSMILGTPTQIIQDWTDIIGLSIIIPSWKLWSTHRAEKPSKLGYGALTIGVLSSIATSPRYAIVRSVTDLEYYKDGIVYAADRENYGEMYPTTAMSNDGGLTWEEEYIEGVEMNGLPIIHCSNLTSDLCFRVTKGGRLEESKDRGNTWTTISAGARDLILFEWESKEYVIVAKGEWGILRRELPNEDWQAIPVLEANK